jgi:hypothetical protein
LMRLLCVGGGGGGENGRRTRGCGQLGIWGGQNESMTQQKL